MSKRIAIIGGGLAGVTAAWQLKQLGQAVTLYEASGRLGGTIETVHREGFVIELGPDGWITEKPWAAQLAKELALGGELIPSNDAGRVTYILRDGRLVAMPEGMRMMVPTDFDALESSSLFSREAIAAYEAEPGRADELRASAPLEDESVASFVLRHFGHEVLHRIAEPLLSGVFGGSVFTLSVQAVMPVFVQLEREFGSLITGLRARTRAHAPGPIFTTLRTGTASLFERITRALPPGSVQLNAPVQALTRDHDRWSLTFDGRPSETHDEVILATPAHITAALIPAVAKFLPHEATSAVIVAFAFDQDFPLPAGFGFLAPAGESALLAATFTDQKFASRAPEGKRLIRAFFGGESAPHIASLEDEAIAELALGDLVKILGPLPRPKFHLVRRWPRSLPQYAVGHLHRLAELDRWVETQHTLHLLGNAYRGVGLPDLIRDARALAYKLASL